MTNNCGGHMFTGGLDACNSHGSYSTTQTPSPALCLLVNKGCPPPPRALTIAKAAKYTRIRDKNTPCCVSGSGCRVPCCAQTEVL